MATPWRKRARSKKLWTPRCLLRCSAACSPAVLLLLCASLITKLVANFTSVEYFSLGIMGISLIAGVSGSSLPKSLISGMIGLLIAIIGMDPQNGYPRLTFGNINLLSGIGLVAP